MRRLTERHSKSSMNITKTHPTMSGKEREKLTACFTQKAKIYLFRVLCSVDGEENDVKYKEETQF